jgi:hypothetical protein
MPKNKGKGGKSRRRGKGDNGDDKRELIFKEDGQEYAQVLTMLGNGRLEVCCEPWPTLSQHPPSCVSWHGPLARRIGHDP